MGGLERHVILPWPVWSRHNPAEEEEEEEEGLFKANGKPCPCGYMRFIATILLHLVVRVLPAVWGRWRQTALL